MSTYQEGDRAAAAVQSALCARDGDTVVVVVDDGSDEPTRRLLRRIADNDERCTLLLRPHRERGRARHEAIETALSTNPDYLFFMDADMILVEGAIDHCIEISRTQGVGAVVVQESPFSASSNFATRVKVFEREIVNDTRRPVDDRSIEAARFWTREAYLDSGGLDPRQTAFEEIQPTIRYRRCGGRVGRASGRWLLHDEKHVRFRDLLRKKSMYFGEMDKTLASEPHGAWDAIVRWYPFRPVYYEPQNIRKYLAHPVLAAGVAAMYSALTISAATGIGRATIQRKRGR